MRSLPNYLINSYHQLTRSNLVLKKDVSIENIKYFETLLNRSIPPIADKEIRAVYYFNKEKYHSNKNGFIKDISIINPMYISLILWTDNKQILKHFDLIGDIYLQWDKNTEKYIVEVYDINKRINNNYFKKPITILKKEDEDIVGDILVNELKLNPLNNNTFVNNQQKIKNDSYEKQKNKINKHKYMDDDEMNDRDNEYNNIINKKNQMVVQAITSYDETIKNSILSEMKELENIEGTLIDECTHMSQDMPSYDEPSYDELDKMVNSDNLSFNEIVKQSIYDCMKPKQQEEYKKSLERHKKKEEFENNYIKERMDDSNEYNNYTNIHEQLEPKVSKIINENIKIPSNFIIDNDSTEEYKKECDNVIKKELTDAEKFDQYETEQDELYAYIAQKRALLEAKH